MPPPAVPAWVGLTAAELDARVESQIKIQTEHRSTFTDNQSQFLKTRSCSSSETGNAFQKSHIDNVESAQRIIVWMNTEYQNHAGSVNPHDKATGQSSQAQHQDPQQR